MTGLKSGRNTNQTVKIEQRPRDKACQKQARWHEVVGLERVSVEHDRNLVEHNPCERAELTFGQLRPTLGRNEPELGRPPHTQQSKTKKDRTRPGIGRAHTELGRLLFVPPPVSGIIPTQMWPIPPSIWSTRCLGNPAPDVVDTRMILVEPPQICGQAQHKFGRSRCLSDEAVPASRGCKQA